MANVFTGKVCGNVTEANGSGDQLQNFLGCGYSVAERQINWYNYREAVRPKFLDRAIGTVLRALLQGQFLDARVCIGGTAPRRFPLSHPGVTIVWRGCASIAKLVRLGYRPVDLYVNKMF